MNDDLRVRHVPPAVAEPWAPSSIRPLRWVLTLCGVLTILAGCAFLLPLVGMPRPIDPQTMFFLLAQDLPVMPLFMLSVLLLGWGAGGSAAPTERRAAWLAGFSVLAVVLLAWAGREVVMQGHDLSRDEQMATFDAEILGAGRLFWPVAPEWRALLPALNQLFILPIGTHEAWISAYLPGNAALRAALGPIASPLLVGLGALALWSIGRRLFPNDPASRLVSLALYVASAQVLVTGMTVYAMSAHLGLNLLWLALFLRGCRACHVGAVLVGFLATGLHQPLFHPLFVAPFLLLLARQERWRLLLAYGAAYALIGLFWLAWPMWISAHGVGPTTGTEAVGYLERLTASVERIDRTSVGVMAMNLVRFVTWQHLLLLPLVAAGLAVAWRGDSMARCLALGLILPIVTMFVLLPAQGHGWGYRYLHGVIGNACLLGAYGWQALRSAGLRLGAAFAVATAATVLVILPLRSWQAYAFVRPYAEAGRFIAASGADLAFVQANAAHFARDLVINRPDLSNRPLRLLADLVPPAEMARLCAGGRLAIVIGADRLRPVNDLFGLTIEGEAADAILRERIEAAGCRLLPAAGERAGAPPASKNP